MGSVTPSSLPNLRDAGGYPTLGGGRVRDGELFRSSALVGLSAAQVASLERLRLRSIFDLRGPTEREQAPDIVPDGADYSAVDVLAGSSGLTPAAQEQLLADPRIAGQVLEGRSAIEVSEQRFRELVRLEGARRALNTVFTRLAHESGRPALIHCTTGKDRTGWVIAALLTLLDVPREHVMHDYLLSAELLEPVTEPTRREFVSRGGDATLFDALWGVRRENLEAAFDEMERAYETVDGYFERGLGIDASTRRALREAFVASPSS